MGHEAALHEREMTLAAQPPRKGIMVNQIGKKSTLAGTDIISNPVFAEAGVRTGSDPPVIR